MSVWTNKSAIAVYVACAGAAFWWWGGAERLSRTAESTGLHTSRLVQNCETAIQDRLRSPASYKRISVRQAVQPMTRDELSARTMAARYRETMAEFDAGSYRPQVWRVAVEFDGVNAFNAPLRGIGLCDSYFVIREARDMAVEIASRP